jgi:ATP-dependent helicase/DNAse subunit B
MDTNEGVLPHLNIYEALVPRDVMIALNLDRLEQEEEIQRYGFMRLISSAKNVHLLYQENRERERSRFVEELVWEKEKAQAQTRVGVVPVMRSGFAVSAQAQKHEVQKTPQMIEFLRNYRYSASSIQTYLRNPMEFYYQHVLGLREQDDLLDEPENRQIGIFIHEFLEEIFKGFIGKPPVIDKIFMEYSRAVLQARFQDYFGKSRRPDTFFLKRVIETRLNQFFIREAERAPVIENIECLEKPFSLTIPLACGEMKFKCVVDRIDRMKDGSLLILDYKTGDISHAFPKDLSEVERVVIEREAILETVRSFQLPLYFYSVRRAYTAIDIDAGLYNLRTQEIKTFLGKKTGNDTRRIESAFLRVLNGVIEEIINPDIPFVEVDGSGRESI